MSLNVLREKHTFVSRQLEVLHLHEKISVCEVAFTIDTLSRHDFQLCLILL